MSQTALNKNELLDVYRKMKTIREFEERLHIDFSRGDIPGFGSGEGGSEDSESDPLYDQAVAIVIKTRKASISSVQRHLRIGYNRAARLIEQMETAGLVSPAEHNGNRSVLAPAQPD